MGFVGILEHNRPILNVKKMKNKIGYFFFQVIKVDHEAHGVDIPEDVEKIESLMCEKNLS